MTAYLEKFKHAQALAKHPGSVVLQTWNAQRAVDRRHMPRAENGSLSMSEFAEFVFGGDSRSTTVTERTAMGISAVYACVSLIGGAIASMPLHIYRRSSDGERKRIDAPEWWLLNEQMFPCWPAAIGWEYTAGSLLLQGDAFWRIHRKVGGLSADVAGFEPLDPKTVTVKRIGERLRYRVSPQPAQTGASESVDLDQDDVIHVPGPGFNGLRGTSQISSALRINGSIALSGEVYQAAFFDNSARPDIVLQTDGNLSKDALESLRGQWEEKYRGAARSHKPAILTGGLKVQPLTMNAVDQQLLESRKFALEDICRVFGVPPWMIGHTEKTTSWGSGIEQMAIGFTKFTLQRHLVKIEQEINRKLFKTAARFCEFSTAGLERGDIKTRNEAYRIALGRAGEPAWLRPSEVRKLENLPPDEELDRMAASTTTASAPNKAA